MSLKVDALHFVFGEDGSDAFSEALVKNVSSYALSTGILGASALLAGVIGTTISIPAIAIMRIGYFSSVVVDNVYEKDDLILKYIASEISSSVDNILEPIAEMIGW